MHNVHDQYAKDTLTALLGPVGPVELEKEVRSEAQRIDLFFTPAPGRLVGLAALGLLGRLTRRPCSLEHFHNTPDGMALVACLRKHLQLCHVLSLEPEPPPMVPLVWVLSSGRPDSGLRGIGLTQGRGWPRGVYLSPPLLRLGVVAINELRETPDTLLLRLLGAGRTLKRAAAELRRMPPDAPEVRVVLPILIRYHLAAATDPEQTSEDKEFAMSTQDVVAMWEQRVRQEEQRLRQEAIAQCQEKFASEVQALTSEAQALASEAQETLRLLYEVRFGPPPASVRARLDRVSDPLELARLRELIGRAPKEQIDRELAGA